MSKIWCAQHLLCNLLFCTLHFVNSATLAPSKLAVSNTSAPNNTVYVSLPDTLFKLPSVLFTASGVNGTSNSIIVVTVQEATFTWAGQSFSPTGPLDPPNLVASRTTWAATSSWQTTNVNGLANRTMVNYSVTENSGSSLLYTEMPYRRVCITAQTTASSIIWCYRIYVHLKPLPVFSCTYTSSLTYDTCPTYALQSKTTIAVGQTFVAYIYFQALNRDGMETTYADQVQISLLSDPGLPNEANLYPTSGGPMSPSIINTPPANAFQLISTSSGSGSTSQPKRFFYSRKLTFTPIATQTLTYSICVVATTTNNWALLQATQLPTQQCYTITVAPPSIMIDPLRTDFGPGMVPASSPTSWPLRVGCTYVYTIVLYEALDFGDVLNGFPSNDAVAGYQSGTYRPVAVVDSENPLPPGAVLSPATSVAVCIDRSLSCVPSKGLGSPVPAYSLQQQTLTWTPQRGMENRTLRVCVLLRDVNVVAGARLDCVDWYVAMCQVCATGGDTLESIAEAYNTDWLQLWGANSALTNPNSLSLPSVLTLGPIYVNPVEQSAALLAKIFAMDLPSFFAVNPTLDPAGLVPVGAAVCVMSTVCT